MAADPTVEDHPSRPEPAVAAGAGDVATGGGRVRVDRRTLLRSLGGLCGTCVLGAAVPLGVGSASAAGGAPRPGTVRHWREAQPDAIARVPVDVPMVALTFDDGPDPRYTREVLRILRAHRARATFFTVGVNVGAYPSLVHEAMAEGHSIGNHTWSHRVLDVLTPDEVAEQIERCQAALAAIGAPSPRLFRPPKGHTAAAVGQAADRSGLRTVFWDACVERLVDHQAIEEGVVELLRRARPGSILLAHDGGAVVGSPRRPLSRDRTLAALPQLLQGLRALGLEVVDVPTLLRAGGIGPGPGTPGRDLLR